MSHRALVAVKQRDGTYNVHYSHNGAEQIQLLDELRDCLNVHGRVDWEELTGTTMPDFVSQMGLSSDSGYTIKKGGSDHVVDPQPMTTGLSKDQLLTHSDVIEFEVLYVVEDGGVEAYWIAWTYPDVIRQWRNHFEVSVYSASRAPKSPNDVVGYMKESDPIRTISDFERDWISDDVVHRLVRDFHRWMYELHAMAVREMEEYDTDESVSRIIQTPEYWLLFSSDSGGDIVPTTVPFVLPILIGTPPNMSSSKIGETVAQIRFEIGAELNAMKNPSEEDVLDAYSEAFARVMEEYSSDVEPQFLPEPVGDIIRKYQQSQEIERMRSIWKN